MYWILRSVEMNRLYVLIPVKSKDAWILQFICQAKDSLTTQVWPVTRPYLNHLPSHYKIIVTVIAPSYLLK